MESNILDNFPNIQVNVYQILKIKCLKDETIIVCMFKEILPEDLNIYAIGSSDMGENSLAKYCRGNNNISHPLHTYGVCLGDIFGETLMKYM